MARVAKRRERQDIQLQKAESGIKVYQTAIYARLSREDNLSNSDSIENQIALLERYIDARPYLQLADIFADNGWQSETAVHSMVDFFLLIQLAGTGDELQGIKRGLSLIHIYSGKYGICERRQTLQS